MNKLEAMRIFMRVADLSSFSLAGKQLNKSPAAITRNVAMLEAQLNVRLMNRSTRRLSLTEAGKVYLDGCRAVTNALDAVESGWFAQRTITAVSFALRHRRYSLQPALPRC